MSGSMSEELQSRTGRFLQRLLSDDADYYDANDQNNNNNFNKEEPQENNHDIEVVTSASGCIIFPDVREEPSMTDRGVNGNGHSGIDPPEDNDVVVTESSSSAESATINASSSHRSPGKNGVDLLLKQPPTNTSRPERALSPVQRTLSPMPTLPVRSSPATDEGVTATATSNASVASTTAGMTTEAGASTNGGSGKPDIRLWLLQNQLSTLREEVQSFQSTMKNTISDWKERAQTDTETVQQKLVRQETSWNTQFSALTRSVQTAVADTKKYCRDELVKKQIAASELAIMGKVSNEYLLPVQEQYRELELAIQYQSNELREALEKQQGTVANLEKALNVRKIIIEGFERQLNTVSHDLQAMQREWKNTVSNLDETAVKVADTVNQLSDQWKDQQSILLQKMKTQENMFYTWELTMNSRYNEYERLHTQVQDMVDSVQQIQESYQQALVGQRDIANQLDQYQTIRAQAEDEFRSYIQQTIQKEIDATKLDVSHLRNAFQQYKVDKEKEAVELDQELDEKQEAMDTLQATVEMQSQEIAAMKAELAQARLEREEVQKEIAKNMEVQNTLFDYLVKQVQSQGNELKTNTTAVASLQQNFQSTTADFEKKLEIRKQVTDRLVETVQHHTTALQDSTDDRMTIRRMVTNTVEHCQNEITKLHDTLSDHSQTRDRNFQVHSEKHDTLVSRLETKENQLEALQRQMEQHDVDLTSLQKRVEEHVAETTDTVQSAVASVREEIQTLGTQTTEQHQQVQTTIEDVHEQINAVRLAINDESQARTERYEQIQRTLDEQIQPSITGIQGKVAQQQDSITSINTSITTIESSIQEIQAVQQKDEALFSEEVETRNDQHTNVVQQLDEHTGRLGLAEEARVALKKELDQKMEVRHVMFQHLVKQVQQGSEEFKKYQQQVADLHNVTDESIVTTTQQIEQLEQAIAQHVVALEKQLVEQKDAINDQFSQQESVRAVDKKEVADTKKEFEKILALRQTLFDQLVRQVQSLQTELHGTKEQHVELNRSIDTQFAAKTSKIDAVNEQIQQLAEYIQDEREQRTARETELIDTVHSETSALRTEVLNVMETQLNEIASELQSKVSTDAFKSANDSYDTKLDTIEQTVKGHETTVVMLRNVIHEQKGMVVTLLSKASEEVRLTRNDLVQRTNDLRAKLNTIVDTTVEQLKNQIQDCTDNIVSIQGDIESIKDQIETTTISEDRAVAVMDERIQSSSVTVELETLKSTVQAQASSIDMITNQLVGIQTTTIQGIHASIGQMKKDSEIVRRELSQSLDDTVSTKIQELSTQLDATQEDVTKIRNKMEQYYDNIESNITQDTKDRCDGILQHIDEVSEGQYEKIMTEIRRELSSSYVPIPEFQQHVVETTKGLQATRLQFEEHSITIRNEVEEKVQNVVLQQSATASKERSVADNVVIETARQVKDELNNTIKEHEAKIQELRNDVDARKKDVRELYDSLTTEKEHDESSRRELESKVTTQLEDVLRTVQKNKVDAITVSQALGDRIDSQTSILDEVTQQVEISRISLNELSDRVTVDRDRTETAQSIINENIASTNAQYDILAQQVLGHDEELENIHNTIETPSNDTEVSYCYNDLIKQIESSKLAIQELQETIRQDKGQHEQLVRSLEKQLVAVQLDGNKKVSGDINDRSPPMLSEVNSQEAPLYENSACIVELLRKIESLDEKVSTLQQDVKKKATTTSRTFDFEDNRMDSPTSSSRGGDDPLEYLTHQIELHAAELQMIRTDISTAFDLRDEHLQTISSTLDTQGEQVDSILQQLETFERDIQQSQAQQPVPDFALLKDLENKIEDQRKDVDTKLTEAEQSYRTLLQDNLSNIQNLDEKVQGQIASFQRSLNVLLTQQRSPPIPSDTVEIGDDEAGTMEVDVCYDEQVTDFLALLKNCHDKLTADMEELKLSLEDSQSVLKTSLDADIASLRTKTSELESISNNLQTSIKELQTVANDQQSKLDRTTEAHTTDYTELKTSIELQITRLDGYVNDIRDYIEDSMTKVDDLSHRTLTTEPGTRTTQSNSDVLKQTELQMQEFMHKINTQLDEIRSSRRTHIPFDYEGYEKDLWMQRLDELEQRVQEQADELQATKELRDGVEQQLEEKTTALRKVERTLETTSELLKETKWENRGLRVTLSGMQQQQEQYRRSFQKLHDERLKGLLAAGSPTSNLNSNNSVISTLSSSTRGTAAAPNNETTN